MAGLPALARPALPVRVRAMIVGRTVTLVITTATPVPPTTVQVAARPVPVIIGVEDGAPIVLVNGSRVLAWVSVVRGTEFAGIASVLTVGSSVVAGALSHVTLAVQRQISEMRQNELPL